MYTAILLIGEIYKVFLCLVTEIINIDGSKMFQDKFPLIKKNDVN